MAKRKSAAARKFVEYTESEVEPSRINEDPGKLGPRSAGHSGENQGLSRDELSANESVEELADTDQSLEAGIVEGVERAGNHPEEPVPDPEAQLRRKSSE